MRESRTKTRRCGKPPDEDGTRGGAEKETHRRMWDVIHITDDRGATNRVRQLGGHDKVVVRVATTRRRGRGDNDTVNKLRPAKGDEDVWRHIPIAANEPRTSKRGKVFNDGLKKIAIGGRHALTDSGANRIAM